MGNNEKCLLRFKFDNARGIGLQFIARPLLYWYLVSFFLSFSFLWVMMLSTVGKKRRNTIFIRGSPAPVFYLKRNTSQLKHLQFFCAYVYGEENKDIALYC